MSYIIEPDLKEMKELADGLNKAIDLVYRIDMLMSQNSLGVISAADVTGALFGMGFGNMTRGEILRGGGYA